jgi:phospholipid/cholesterol/gamma-HCH transport system substrate-binding protein
MPRQRNAVRAGIFMLVSLALIVYVIIAISGAARFTQSFKTYPVAFSLQDDLGGLRPGDDVRIGGYRVGNIRDIQVQPAKSALIVIIDIPAKYALAKNAHVQLQQGLTGASAINIDDLGSGPLPGPNDVLIGTPSTTSSLTRVLGAIEPDLRQTLANLKVGSAKLNVDLDKLAKTSDSLTAAGAAATETVRDVHARVPEILDHYKSVTEAAVDMLHAWRDFLGPSSLDFHQTVANLNHITTDLRQRIPPILDHVQAVVARAADAVRDIQTTARNLSATTSSLRSLLVDNRSKLDGLIESLKQTSDNLKYASVEIRHSPWRLLYKPKPDEVANLNIYDSVRQFAQGADSLDDAASALRDALKDPNTNPEQLHLLMQHLDDSFTKFQTIQQKLWTDIKE